MKPYKFLVMLGLLALACVSPAIITPMPEKVNTPVHVYTEVPQATPVKTATVTAYETANVRSEPTEHSPAVGYLEHGDSVSVYECAQAEDGGRWARIGEGYVNARYLSAGACELP